MFCILIFKFLIVYDLKSYLCLVILVKRKSTCSKNPYVKEIAGNPWHYIHTHTRMYVSCDIKPSDFPYLSTRIASREYVCIFCRSAAPTLTSAELYTRRMLKSRLSVPRETREFWHTRRPRTRIKTKAASYGNPSCDMTERSPALKRFK